MKRNRCMLLIVMFIFIIAMPITANAATLKLSKKKATLTVGKTVQLKVNGTKKSVKWSSSNKKIATVSKKGKVKGKKVGKAVITAKVGKKKLKCKITVKKKKTTKGKKPQFSTNHIKLNLLSHTSDTVKLTNLSTSQMKKVKVWVADENDDICDDKDISFTVSGKSITVKAKNPGVFFLCASYNKIIGHCKVTIDGLYDGIIYDGKEYYADEVSQSRYGDLLCKAYPNTYGVFRRRYVSKCKTEFAKILCINRFFIDNNYQYSATVFGGEHYFNTFKVGKCTDYATETYNLCCVARIPVETVHSNELNHMWDQVCLGGAWHPLDMVSNQINFYPLGYKTTFPKYAMICRGDTATGNRSIAKKGYELTVNGLKLDLSKCLIEYCQDGMRLQIFPKLELKEQLKDKLEHGKYVFYDLKNDFVDGKLP